MARECFVCLRSDGVLHRVCACNAVVHAHCLRDTMQRVASHRRTCAVCKESYAVVQFIHRPAVHHTHRPVCGSYACFAALSVGYACLFAREDLPAWAAATLAVVWVLSGTLVVLLHAHIYHATRHANCCGWALCTLRVRPGRVARRAAPTEMGR
jgi:hypothetical protein